MKTESSFLLIDNSNSRTKFCLQSAAGAYSDLRVLPTDSITPLLVADVVSDWSFSSVFICSVVPRVAAILADSFQVPVRFLNADGDLPVDFSCYPGIHTLGADRIANVIGAVEWNRFPFIAVDLGTAITFDVVEKSATGKPFFRGGIIAPGLGVFRDYLSVRTALLRPFCESDLHSFTGIGQDTLQAVQFGFRSGAKGMIQQILDDISASLDAVPFIIATGGDAKWAEQNVKGIATVDSLLTFRGLSRFAQK